MRNARGCMLFPRSPSFFPKHRPKWASSMVATVHRGMMLEIFFGSFIEWLYLYCIPLESHKVTFYCFGESAVNKF